MKRKTETLNIRVTSDLKELVRLAAEKEHRTLANFVEVLVRNHCDEHQIYAGNQSDATRPQRRKREE